MHLSAARRAACICGVRRVCSLRGMDRGVLAFFVPGLMSRLAALATEDEKASTPLLAALMGATRAVLLGCATDDANAAALRAADLSSSPSEWIRALHAKAMAPGAGGAAGGADEGSSSGSSCLGGSTSGGGGGDDPFRVAISSEWLDATGRRLAPLLSRLCVAAAAGRWRARSQLVAMARALLVRCALSLHACVPVLLEHLCAATRDPYPQVDRAAVGALHAVGRRFALSAPLAALLREGLEKQLRQLPAIVRSVNEPAKARAFAVLSAQVELLHASGSLRRLLSARLGALSTALLGALAVAPSDSVAIETRLRRPRRLSLQHELNAASPTLQHELNAASPTLQHEPNAASPTLQHELNAASPTLQHELNAASPTLQHEPNAASPSPCGDRSATSSSMAETPAARLLRHARYSAPPHAHLRDGRTLIAAKELCATLGSLSSISAWVHHLLPALATTPEGTAGAFKAPALWLLDQLLRGAGGGGRWCRVGRVAGLVVEARDEVDKEEVDEGLGADADADVDEEVDEGAGVEAGVKVGVDAPRPSTTAAEAREAAAAALDTAPASPLMGAIIGASSPAEVEECMLMLLREVLSPELWNAPSAVSGATSPASLRRQHATLVEHEAMIELVGSAVELLAAAVRARAAQALGANGSVGAGGVGASSGGVGGCSSIQVALRLSLFPLLERLGDRAAALSSAAELTLCRMCVALDDPRANGSVAQLLSAHGDFLLDALGARLRHGARYPHTAQAVQAVIEFGGETALPIAGDLLDDVLRLVDEAMPTAQVPTPARRRLDYLRYSQTAGMLPGTTIPSAAAAAATDRVGLSQIRVGLSPAAEPLRGRLLDETKALTLLPSFTPSFTAAEEQRLHGWLRALHVIALACREQLREQLRAPQPYPPPPQPFHAHESARRAEEPAANDERTEAREEAAAAEAAEEGGGWLQEDTPGEATLEDFMGELVTELLGPAPEVLAAGTAKAALEEKEEEEEDLPGQEEEEEPEAALRRAEALEKEANTPPAAGQLALQLLRKSEVLLLSGCPSITHAVLDILSEVLPALAQWPRAALPAAYPLWPPLLALLDGDDRSVAAHAMRAFGLAVSCYGIELSTRVQSQAIEHLIDALIRYTAAPAAVVNTGGGGGGGLGAGGGDGGVGSNGGAGAVGGGASPAVKALLASVTSAGTTPPSLESPSVAHSQLMHRSLESPSVGRSRSGGGGRNEEVLLAALRTLRLLCASPRAMRPYVLRTLRASAPLLSRQQPETVQAAAVAVGKRLARLDPDTVFLFCVCFVPPAERWTSSPPAGCVRPELGTLLTCSLPASDLVANARSLLRCVARVDELDRRGALCPR